MIALLALALPAGAADCQTGGIDRWDNGGPHWIADIAYDGNVDMSIEGHFLWLRVGQYDDEYEDVVSVEVPADAIGATACADGVVTFSYAPESISQQPESYDLAELYPDIVAHWLAPGAWGAG